jgi:hypothetical protein
MDGKPQVTAGLTVSSKLHILSDRSRAPAWKREADRSGGYWRRLSLETFPRRQWEQSNKRLNLTLEAE